MKRFEDYKQEVILAYEKKKKDGKLSPNLIRHTTANLKRECIEVFFDRYSDRDEHTFISLFGKANSREEYFTLVRESDPDVFRPLNNFLRGNADGTREKNIELLAWLIDFEPRPLYKYIEVGNSDFPEPGRKPVPKERKHPENIIYKIIVLFRKSQEILGLFIALVIGIIIYIVTTGHDQQCMYWDGKQYESIACDQKVDGANIIAQDTLRLNRLKKITNISSITRNDIRKIYYSKIDNKVEFYTAGGENPEDARKRLLPMTERMFKKYVLHENLP